jgi:DNA-binding MarR family transcriptional regulator
VKKYDPMDEDYNLWLFLAQVRAVMLAAREKEVNRYGITASQASVLFVINATGREATPAEVSRWIFRKSSTVAGILNRLEKQGLVRRTSDLERKNNVRLDLTDKGREIHNKATIRRSIHEIMACLDQTERRQLESCLEKIQTSTMRYIGRETEIPFPY